jgi:hypothetical protein
MDSTNVSSDTLTIEAVKSRFEHWRATRTKRSKIPDTLWDDVRQLSKKYGYSQLSSQLGISYPQLHAHLGEREQQSSLDPTFNFINADIPFLQSSSPHLPQWPLPINGTLEVQGCNGLNFKVSGLSQQDLIALIHIFLKR